MRENTPQFIDFCFSCNNWIPGRFILILGNSQTMDIVAGHKHGGPDKIVQPQAKNNGDGLVGLQTARFGCCQNEER